jgi:eukaryotic-like serine/threonine-protein kinase
MTLAFAGIMLLLLSRPKPAPDGTTVDSLASAEPVDVDAAPAAMREVALELGGFDAAGWRMNLRNAARRKEWQAGAEAVLALVRLDPGAFRDHDVQAAARSTAVALEDGGGETSDKFFDALIHHTGGEGLDMLYDIARFRTVTRAGKRATEALRRPEVMTRGSLALKILFDFREASCVGKRDLFARMAEQGDERALLELQALRDAECQGRRDPCCYKENRALAAAIRSLKSRLSAPPQAP